VITFAVIHLGPEEVSPSLIERLRSIYADRIFKQGFFLKLPVDDPRAQEAIKLLDESGLHPWRSETGAPVKGVEYTFRMDRQYEPSDLAQCSLLELSPPDEAHNAEAIFRAHDGEMIVPQGSTPDGFDIMSSLPCWCFVPERVKTILEAGDFRHILFRPTVHVPHMVELDELGNPIELVPDMGSIAQVGRLPGEPVHHWELDSDFTLPPLAPTMTLTDSEWKPVRSGDFARGFHRREGFYSHPELHYRASDLEGLEPFDLARTYEPFGNRHGYAPLARTLVASRRFYEYCIRHGLRTGWVPVRIDHD